MITRIILFMGICYVGLLLSFVDQEIAFSEDSGIKTLMVKQYQKGQFQSTLTLGAPHWVEQLWTQGLYPFRKPFVYDLPTGKTVVFPPLFQIISTPFFSLFGFKGLYIIPALSTILLWMLFIKVCNTLKLNEKITQLALIAFIFSSSLTIYSAIFWEHTLASLLCLCGLYYLIQASVKSQTDNPIQNRTLALLFGIVTGLSLWLRPEALIILIALLSWSAYWLVYARMKFIQFFMYGIVLSITGFFIFNYCVFHNPLGLRSNQIVDQFNLMQRLKDGGYIFIVLCTKTILFDPFSLLIVFCLGITIRKQFYQFKASKTVSLEHLLIVSICFFYLSAPWLLPNTGGSNWGIRYALVCTPFIYVLAALLSNQIMVENLKVKPVIIISLLLVIAGTVKNTVMGSKMLFENYHGSKSSVLRYLTKEKPAVILITKSSHAGEFENMMPEAAFILVDTKESLQKFTDRPESNTVNSILIYDTNDTYSKLLLKESELSDFVLDESFTNFKMYRHLLK